MNNTKAFSLIELMVVIAIVAVLAAIAVPVYKRYLITSRLASLVPVIEQLISQAKTFHTVNGRFPNAYDLGLRATPGDAVDDATASQIIGTYYIQGSATNIGGYQGLNIQPWPGDGCTFNNTVNIWVYLDAAKIGFDSSEAQTLVNGYNAFGGVVLNCLIASKSGVYNTSCQYGYGTEPTSGLDELIPGWINQNLTEAWDLSGYYDWPGWYYPCE